MNEETKSLSELKHPEWNPRRIEAFDFNNLVNSLKEFGDLSGVVRNIATGNLAGGNQRVEAFKKLDTDRIIITQRMSDGPTAVGTVAHGYIVMPSGEQYSYREVLWPVDAEDESGQPYSSKEKAANVAANHITGDDDKELLAKLDYDLSQLENGDDLLALTGQSEKEIEKLLQSVGVGDDPGQPNEDEPENENNKLTFALSRDQKELVEQALTQAKAVNAIPHTNLDNINGTALYIICQQYVQNSTSQNADTQIQTTDIQPPTETVTPVQTGIEPGPTYNETPDLTSIPTDQVS